LKFVNTFKTPELLEIENLNILKKIIQHCLKASAKLLADGIFIIYSSNLHFLSGQGQSSLELLEAIRTLVSQVPVKDPVFEKLKALIYNNISAYCSR